MTTVTDDGRPATTAAGRLEPSATVKVSSSASVSCAVVSRPMPEVSPCAMAMAVSDPTSPDSAVFGVAVVTVTGIDRALGAGLRSCAVTSTTAPSRTRGGSAESVTALSVGVPAPCAQAPAPLALLARTRTR